MNARTADPYRDLDVIDARAPRFNQAVIGSLALLAVLTAQPWLLALLAVQLAVGLTLGRRWCLPCLFYFEVVQRRFGEGPLEDSRPPRFANAIGVAFLGMAALSAYSGAETVSIVLGSIVAALALLAASTGLCMGCEFYKLAARFRGVSHVKAERIDPGDLEGILNGEAVVQFTHPLCTDCREWEERLTAKQQPFFLVDVRRRPELARKYGVAVVPTVIAVGADGTVLKRLAP